MAALDHIYMRHKQPIGAYDDVFDYLLTPAVPLEYLELLFDDMVQPTVALALNAEQMQRALECQ